MVFSEWLWAPSGSRGGWGSFRYTGHQRRGEKEIRAKDIYLGKKGKGEKRDGPISEVRAKGETHKVKDEGIRAVEKETGVNYSPGEGRQGAKDEG